MKTKIYLTTLLSVTVLSISCSKTEDQSIQIKTQSPITLNSKQSERIEATSVSKIVFTTENEFNATVSDLGVVTANCVGETIINLTNGHESASINVVVEPRYNLYPTPNNKWGATKNEVKSMYGTPSSETASGFSYANYSAAAPILLFLFDDSGSLYSSAVLVKASYISNLADFLLERYVPISVDSDNYTAAFVDGLTVENIKTGVFLSVYNISYVMVLYVDAKSASSKAIEKGEISINKIEQLLEGLTL